MDIAIVVRDTDVPTLNDLAVDQWRTPEQQASALLEQALHVYRAKSDPTVPHRARRTRRVTTEA